MSGILEWWDSIHTFWQAVIPICVVVVLGIIGFLTKRLIHYITIIIQRKRERDNQILYTHFMEIKPEAISIIDILNKITNFYGWLIISRGWPSYKDTSDYELGILPTPTRQFSSHFSEEATKINEYRKHIENHNKRHIELNTKIKQDFESRNFSVIDVNTQSRRPFYIFDNIYTPLYIWWQDSYKPLVNRWINFNKIEIKANENPDNLYVGGWGSQAIACASTDNGKRRCKTAIRKVANDVKYHQDVSYLIVSSRIVLENTKSLAKQIDDKINDTENYWPGIKSYKFKKKKRSCPRCKEIFS
ncbi:MAG: hypothetical protein PVG61_02800 [Dehalococcoidia bacterium]|jgi:hypothetical protein